MVIENQVSHSHSSQGSCPHCKRGFIVWDERDKEPFCFNCGWRRSIRITPAEAAARRKWSILSGAIKLNSLEGDPEELDRVFNGLFAGLF